MAKKSSTPTAVPKNIPGTKISKVGANSMPKFETPPPPPPKKD